MNDAKRTAYHSRSSITNIPLKVNFTHDSPLRRLVYLEEFTCGLDTHEQSSGSQHIHSTHARTPLPNGPHGPYPYTYSRGHFSIQTKLKKIKARMMIQNKMGKLGHQSD